VARKRSGHWRWGVWLLLALGIVAGCVLALLLRRFPAPSRFDHHLSTPSSRDRPSPEHVTTAGLRFTDVTTPAGIRFTHFAGAVGNRWYPETIGSGVAFFDYDGDNWPDILFVNGTHWPTNRQASSEQNEQPTLHLYRNRGDGTFVDVTQQTGMAVPLYGMGVAVADYDNDGDRDVFVSGYVRHLFFVNNGDGTFTEATQRVGIGSGTWGAGAAFFDYDRDGWLDLVLASYVEWSPELEQDLDCTYGMPTKDYCPVHYFRGQGLTLYRNLGHGTFADITQQAGVAAPGARAFAPAILDYNEDGWPDILVACDGTPSLLLRNQGDGTFIDVGVQTGIVLDQGGGAYAGMGIDVAYPHNNNQLCIAIGNFVGEPTTLHCRMQREAHGFYPELYAEMSARAGIGRATLRFVSFGLFFFDADLDRFQDLFIVNGHVIDEARIRNAPRAQRAQLFHNTGAGTFQEVTPGPASVLDRVMVGRGAAYADYDGDGDLDIVVSQNQGPAVLLRNDTPRQSHYLQVRLQGTRSNRDGIGADVHVHSGGQVLRQMVRTGVSYFSQSTLALTFGLGESARAERVDIVWPSGIIDVYHNVPADTTLHAVEGSQPGQPAVVQRAVEPAATPEVQTSTAGEPSNAYMTAIQAGIAAYQAQRYPEATQAFETALPLRPSEPLPYRYLADLYWRQGKPQQAAQTVRQLADVLPDPYFLDRQGSGYEESGLLGLAQLLYAEAIRLDPALPSAHYNLGRAYLVQGETQRGMAEVQEALRLYPDFAEAHETLGRAYSQQGQLQGAISHLQQALELNPEAATARNHLGRIYMAQGRLPEAIATFEQLVQQHANAAEAHHNLAVAYARSGAQVQAIAQFRTALRLRPDFHAARLDLATLFLEMRRPQEAIDALRAILSAPAARPEPASDVETSEVHYRLGLAYLMAQRGQEAIRELEIVLQQKPQHAGAHTYLGTLYYQQRQFDRAWQHARQAEALGVSMAELLAALRRVSTEP
jgi:tetratricopeptide (TPR) repeat protein